ncbi:MAG: radical SAM protein [bacterium]
MKFLFIYPDVLSYDAAYEDNKGRYYTGVAQLSACLRQAGIDTYLIHPIVHPERDEFISEIRSIDPDVIGFSVVTNMYHFVREWVAWIREAGLTQPVIIGGIHPTLDPEGVLAETGADCVCIGEGDAAVVEYAEALRSGTDPTGIQSLWFNYEGSVIRNPIRPLVEDLDVLPFPDWDIYDYNNLYDMKVHRRGTVLASRGCPNNCYYCCNHKMRNVYPNKSKYVRFNTVDYFIAELKEMVRRYPGIEYFLFNDDIFPISDRYLEEFTEKYIREVNLNFACLAHPNYLNPHKLDLLKRAGCVRLIIGVESGNENIRKSLNRRVPQKKIIEAFTSAHERGIQTVSVNMVGLPFETRESVLETIRLNAQLRTDLFQISIFYPYPFTESWDICVREGFIKDKKDLEISSCFIQPVIDQPTISRDEVSFLHRHFTRLVWLYTFFDADILFKKWTMEELDGFLSSLEFKDKFHTKWLLSPRLTKIGTGAGG